MSISSGNITLGCLLHFSRGLGDTRATGITTAGGRTHLLPHDVELGVCQLSLVLLLLLRVDQILLLLLASVKHGK